MHHSTLRTEREEDVLFLLIFILIIWSLSFFRHEKEEKDRDDKTFKFNLLPNALQTVQYYLKFYLRA